MTSGGDRRSKPIALRVLQGNPGKRAINRNEPQVEPLADLRPPTWLDATARRCWRENAPVLARYGLLGEADVMAFGLYCQAWSRYRATQTALREIKPDDERYRAIAITLEKAEASMRAIAGEFGMSPQSRARLSVTGGPKDVDPMEELLSGRRSTG